MLAVTVVGRPRERLSHRSGQQVPLVPVESRGMAGGRSDRRTAIRSPEETRARGAARPSRCRRRFRRIPSTGPGRGRADSKSCLTMETEMSAKNGITTWAPSSTYGFDVTSRHFGPRRRPCSFDSGGPKANFRPTVTPADTSTNSSSPGSLAGLTEAVTPTSSAASLSLGVTSASRPSAFRRLVSPSMYENPAAKRAVPVRSIVPSPIGRPAERPGWAEVCGERCPRNRH